MSRLLVKGLPDDYTTAALTKQFEQQGFKVTDSKLLRRNGVSRRMAFVGLATEQDAEKAIAQMDRVWVQGGRLSVEKAREADQQLFARPLKKRKLDLPLSADTPEDVLEDGVAQDSELTDADYLAKRRKRTLGAAPVQTAEEPEVDQQQAPFANGRLFLRNLPFAISSADLEAHFRSFGDITEVKLPAAADGQGTGIGYVSFLSAASAERAAAELDGKPLRGRLLHILPAVDRRAGAEFKSKKAARDLLLGGKLKKDFDKALTRHDEGRGHDATLVLNSDAVVSSLAALLGLSKTDVLDPTSSSAAVKLAQAETSLLTSSLSYFLSHGADLKSLATAGKQAEKSPTTLLLTNLPPGTIQATMRSLLSKCGTVTKLLLPPSGTLAVVEMAGAAEAADVVKSLSYQKLGNSVIYVKRVPATFWTTPVKADGAPGADSQAAEPEAEAEEEQHPTKTLFVQNVSFAVAQDRFQRPFKALPGFVFAKLVPPADPGKKAASKGYGFVGFSSVELAKAAREAMHGHLLDGRALAIGFAKGQGEADEEAAEEADLQLGAGGKKGSAKMLVKNVPFEASLKDLKELFSAYGSIKTLRLPKRADRRSRGFAFVEFASRKECEYAMKVLQNTHLLGRHLKFEFVKEDKLDDLV